MDARSFSSLLVVGALALCSCQEQREASFQNQVPVFPVKGQVFVDGTPAKGVTVTLFPKAQVEQGMTDPEGPSVLKGSVGPQGEVTFTTYQPGDGVPAGEYVATFELREVTKSRGEKEYGPDKLGEKYNDPTKSEFAVSVGEGKSNDLGKIELESAREPAGASG